MAFSILITNLDDHLLDHGFLHDGRGLWRLSPAFDIYTAPERLRELKSWISAEVGPAAMIENFMSMIRYFRIPNARAKEILREVERAVSTWRQQGRLLGMSDVELEQFGDAFEHPERDAARRQMRQVGNGPRTGEQGARH